MAEQLVAALTAEIVALKKQHEIDIKKAVERQKEHDDYGYYCDRELTKDMYEDHTATLKLLSEELRETKEQLRAVICSVSMNYDGDSLPHLVNLQLQIKKRDSIIRDLRDKLLYR